MIVSRNDMTVMNITALRQSFELVAPQSELLTTIFYRELFERYPAVRPLFSKVDLRTQKGKLVASLSLIVKALDDSPRLVAYLQGLGRRHVAYGTLAEHYAPVGECLLFALAEVAGSAWSSELEQAWSEAYGVITEVMLGAARDAVPLGVGPG